MSNIIRMRFPQQALTELRQLDPETPVTLSMIRRLVKTGAIPSVAVGAGKRRLVNFDALCAYLENPLAEQPQPVQGRAQAGSQGGKASAAVRKQKSAIVSNASFACDDEANEAVPVSVSAPASVPVSASVPDLQERFSPLVAGCISEWLAYKKERREAYKPTGLKSLLTEIENRVKLHGEKAVCDVIQLTMSNGWRGIIWEKIKQEDVKTNESDKVCQPEPKLNGVTRL